MKIDGGLLITRIAEAADQARSMESLGYDGVFTFEGKNDPFLPLVLAAEHTERVELTTAIALAFPRSPMSLAYLGHDLQVQSGGRFILGLGSQIRTHIVKRYGSVWSHPVDRMREIVLAIKAIWDCWNKGERLDFQGRFYTHTLMTPIFEPAENPHGAPRIFLAGVQPRMIAAAGEVADGLIVHPLNSPEFLQQRLLPALDEGLAKAARPTSACPLSMQVLLIAGADDQQVEEAAVPIKQQMAFYASTPAYRTILEAHGWGDLQEELRAMSKRGEWEEMGLRITDDMLDAFTVRGRIDQIPGIVRNRFDNRVERLSFISYAGLENSNREQWMEMMDKIRKGAE